MALALILMLKFLVLVNSCYAFFGERRSGTPPQLQQLSSFNCNILHLNSLKSLC